MRKLILILTSVCLTISLAGCGDQKETKTTLNVYTAWEDDELAKFVAAYEKDHSNVKLNIIRDSTGVIAAKLMAEKDNPQADIIWAVAASGVLGISDTLAKYSPVGLENIDRKFYDQQNETPKWIGITAYMNVFSTNSIELKNKEIDFPTSYAQLLNPIYKGEIIMPNPASSGTGFFTVSGWLYTMGEEKGWAYMDKLHKNIKMYVHSGSAPTKMAAQGEVLIGLGMGFRSLEMQAKGSPLITTFPNEGSGWDTEVIAIVKKESIKKEAKAFVDWAISKEAMQLYVQKRGIVTFKNLNSTLKGYPTNIVAQLANVDMSWAAKNRERILKEWQKRYAKN